MASSATRRPARLMQLLLVGALALGGCTAHPTAGPEAAAVRPSIPEAPPTTPPPRPGRKPAPPAAAVPPASTSAPTPSAPVDPDRLIGLTQPEAMAMLGEPSQRAEAAPATIWRYTGPGCEIDLYFYLDLQSKVTRVLDYKIRSGDPAEQQRERCFEQLVSEQRARAPDGSGSTHHPR